MAINRFFWLSGFCIIIGALYSAFNNELLIIRSPLQPIVLPQESSVTTKKKIVLTYWHHNTWHTETSEILWSGNTTHNLTNLVNCWLNVLDEERMAAKKICLQSAILTASGSEVLLSFDHCPFAKDGSTYDKWHWVEGLLRTITSSGLPLQQVRLLVHHQELVDTHLDFSHSWPINGFLS